MIIDKLKELDEFISSVNSFVFLRTINIDDALDLRDSDPFDSEWMNHFDRLNSIKLSDDENERINSLREKAFKLSFRIIKNPEISSRISDDIELIAKDLLLGNQNHWPISYLLMSYKNGSFPT